MISLDNLNIETEWRRFYEWFHLINRSDQEDLSVDLTPETKMFVTPVADRWRVFIPQWSIEEAKDWMQYKLEFACSLDEYIRKYDLDHPDQFPWPYELVDVYAGLGLLYRSKWRNGVQDVVQIFLTADGHDLAKNNI